MSLTDWFKRLFSSSSAEPAEEAVATQPAGQDAPAGEQAASQGAEAAEAQPSDREPTDQTP
jgi:hypothetical protein